MKQLYPSSKKIIFILQIYLQLHIYIEIKQCLDNIYSNLYENECIVYYIKNTWFCNAQKRL